MGKLRELLVSQLEPEFEKRLPYAGHIKPDVVQHFDGTLHAMFWFHGVPFELALGSERNGRVERINNMMRMISDPDISLSFHLVRHQHAPPAPQLAPPAGFVGSLLHEYQRVALDGMYTNDWLVSVMCHPPADINKYTSWIRRNQLPVIDDIRLKRLEDVCSIISTTLKAYVPVRLGLRNVPVDNPEAEIDETEDAESVDASTISEIATALYLIRTAKYRLIPHTSGALAASIYAEPTEFGRTTFKTDPHEKRYGAIITFLNYPRKARAGMFNTLLGTNYPLVMTHQARFKGSGSVSGLDLTLRQMRAAGEKSKTLMAQGEDMMDRISSLKAAEVMHHFSLAVYAPSIAELDNVANSARNLVQQFGGAVPVRDSNVLTAGAMAASYWSQMPGASILRPRPGRIDTTNLANMASLDNYAAGSESGHWGKSPLRFRTNGGTAYDWVPHNEDVGHSLVIGRTGAGKTVFLGFVLLAMQQAVGKDGIRLLIDKDESNRLAIEAGGGIYQKLWRGRPSGLAPLVAFPDTPETRAFLHGLYKALILSDGRTVSLTNLEDHRLTRGIARQMKLPPEKRSMGGVREFLGYGSGDDGAGERFERWCAGGSMGWLLDNKEHHIKLGGGLYGIDFTELLPAEGVADDGSCRAAAAVITEQLKRLMDGRRIMTIFEECRFYINVLSSWIDDLTHTGRKKEVIPWLIFQQASHAIESKVGKTLVSQMRSKYIFPDASHDVEALQDMHLSPAAIRMLRSDMTIGNARRFLLWRPEEPVICEFDLSKMRHLGILSGRPGTIALWEQVKERGLGPTEFMDQLEANKPQPTRRKQIA